LAQLSQIIAKGNKKNSKSYLEKEKVARVKPRDGVANIKLSIRVLELSVSSVNPSETWS
jgi:hypothetical protein